MSGHVAPSMSWSEKDFGLPDGKHTGTVIRIDRPTNRYSTAAIAGSADIVDMKGLASVSTYAPVDHPGIIVPENLRSWTVPWPDYRPVDITPPELRPAGLATSVAEGWAEPHLLPIDVPDWSARQAAALVPFKCDDRGWPLNPTGRTGRTGRNLGRWGENQAADPAVVAGTGTDRRILLIKRSDNGLWSFPGGMVDPGENAPKTLVRELREETGVDLADKRPAILSRSYVFDWRATDHAWVTSTLGLFELPSEVAARAADDAADAGWFPFGSLAQLDAAVARVGGLIYPAHRPMLITVFTRLSHTR
jgi:ADP-ribose pyrophosphatase